MCTLYLTYRAGILVFIFFIQIFFHIKTRTYRAYILRLFGNFRFLSNLRASPTGKFSIESNKFAGKLRVSMKTSYLSCLRIRAQNCIFWLFDCTVYSTPLRTVNWTLNRYFFVVSFSSVPEFRSRSRPKPPYFRLEPKPTFTISSGFGSMFWNKTVASKFFQK